DLEANAIQCRTIVSAVETMTPKIPPSSRPPRFARWRSANGSPAAYVLEFANAVSPAGGGDQSIKSALAGRAQCSAVRRRGCCEQHSSREQGRLQNLFCSATSTTIATPRL